LHSSSSIGLERRGGNDCSNRIASVLDERLVCLYIDDTGQQSHGRFFVVAGLAIADNHAAISRELERVEVLRGKRLRDWHHTTPERRVAYLTKALTIGLLHGGVFYKIFRDAPSTQHPRLRSDSVQAAIGAFARTNRRAIHYEGLTRTTRESLRCELRRRGLRCDVRNGELRRFPELRLADSLSAMIAKVHFSTDGPDYAQLMKPWFAEL
jgi:hypothetical protein